MLRRMLSPIPILVIAVTFPVLAAKFWDKRDYSSWTEENCLTLISDSPWVTEYRKRYQIREQWAHVLRFTFLSAEPIKRAIAQLRFIDNPGRPNFRAQVEKWMKASPKDEIIISVTSFAVPASFAEDILRPEEVSRYFREVSFEQLAEKTKLIAGRSKKQAPLKKYIPPSSRSPYPLFIFPRLDESGQPFFTGNDKSVELRTELNMSILGGKTRYKVRAKWKVRDMTFKNNFTL